MAAPKLTDSQRDRLTKAGVDPDRWLAQELKNAPELKKQGSGWIENHLGQQESAGTLPNSTNATLTPNAGEAINQRDKDGKLVGILKGPPPKQGNEWIFVDMKSNSDGSLRKVPVGKGTIDPVTGAPSPTAKSTDGGKTFEKGTFKTNPNGQPVWVPEGGATAAAASAASNTAAKPFTPVGYAPDDQANSMTPEEEQSYREGGFTQNEIDSMKVARSGKKGYAEFDAPSPGNTQVLKRGDSLAMPMIGPNGEALGGTSGSLSIPVPTSVDEVLQSMYQLPADKLKKLQTDLFQAGYYQQAKLEDVPLGNPDMSTLTAYHAFLSDVAQRNRAGQRVTVEDVLESGAASRKSDASKSKFQPIDARDAALVADQVAQKVLGRKATANDQRLILAALNQAGQLSFTAQQDNTVATNPASPTAVATDLLRQQNPVEATAYGVLDQFHTFAAMLGGT